MNKNNYMKRVNLTPNKTQSCINRTTSEVAM